MSQNNLKNTRFMAVHNFINYFNNYCIYNNNLNKVYSIYNNEEVAINVRDIMIREVNVNDKDIAIIPVCKYMSEYKQKDICMKKALELFNN